MARENPMTGMLGVYLVAAELTARGFVVSPTSRNARGADLLVTDQQCRKSWSVQVKTNRKPGSTWLLTKGAYDMQSDTNVYMFVNIRSGTEAKYLEVASKDVAAKARQAKRSTGSIGHWFHRDDAPAGSDEWTIFGDPAGPSAAAEA